MLYHLQKQTILQQVLPWCGEHGVTVVSYNPFYSGRFVLCGERAKVLGEVESSRGTSTRQVALGFLTRRKSLFTIPKSSNFGHVAENHQASEIELSEAEFEQLEKAFSVGRRRSGLPTL